MLLIKSGRLREALSDATAARPMVMRQQYAEERGNVGDVERRDVTRSVQQGRVSQHAYTAKGIIMQGQQCAPEEKGKKASQG